MARSRRAGAALRQPHSFVLLLCCSWFFFLSLSLSSPLPPVKCNDTDVGEGPTHMDGGQQEEQQEQHGHGGRQDVEQRGASRAAALGPWPQEDTQERRGEVRERLERSRKPASPGAPAQSAPFNHKLWLRDVAGRPGAQRAALPSCFCNHT